MKGCARTCLLWFVAWGVAAYAFYTYFRSLGGDLETAPIVWASIFAGLFVAFCIGYVQVILQAALERKTLLEAASGTPPQDGKWIAASGRIHSMHALRGPLSDASVVAYQYKVWRSEGSGKSRAPVSHYEGKALVPSTIATRSGSIRLLAVPLFDVSDADLPDDKIQNARQYIARTQFETDDTPKEQRAGTVEKESTDDDGSFRVDKRSPNAHNVPLETCMFEEKHIAQNETVCAFGLYSQQRGGLVPHPNWAYQTRVMRGDAESVAAQLKKRMVRYALGIVAFGTAAYVVVRIVRAASTAY